MARTQLVFFIVFILQGAQLTGQTETHLPENVARTLASLQERQKMGNYTGAKTILVHALSTTPESAPLLLALGIVDQSLGEYAEAERTYRRALKASEQSGDAAQRLTILGNMGALYLDTSQFSQAEGVRAQLEKSQTDLERNPALLNVMATLVGPMPLLTIYAANARCVRVNLLLHQRRTSGQI